jgi:hypothetical protein
MFRPSHDCLLNYPNNVFEQNSLCISSMCRALQRPLYPLSSVQILFREPTFQIHILPLTWKTSVSPMPCRVKIIIVYTHTPTNIYIYTHRMFQEERSIFWEVIVSVILSKKLYMNMCPIPNGFRDRAIWLYSGLAWAPSIVLPSRPAAPLSEACWRCNFRTFIINCTNSVTWTINTGIRNSTHS